MEENIYVLVSSAKKYLTDDNAVLSLCVGAVRSLAACACVCVGEYTLESAIKILWLSDGEMRLFVQFSS